MGVGPIEKLILLPEDPVLPCLIESVLSGPVEFFLYAGVSWLVEKMPTRDFFTGKYIVEARRITSIEKIGECVV
jgi:hypothetical protein